jgi:hypothetical protein
MSGSDMRPEAVERAAAWLVENEARFAEDALTAQLASAGYTETEIAAARSEAERRIAGGPTPTDLRARASTIVLTAFIGTWLVLAWLLMAGPSSTSYGSLAAGILAIVLAPIGLISVAIIENNGSLRRGATGAFAAALAIPFVFLVVIAGSCVATTGLRV